MIDSEKRMAFADFLDRLCTSQPIKKDWFEYVVNHYHDETIEAIRVSLVKLSIKSKDSSELIDENRAQIEGWAKALRNSADIKN